MVVMPVSLRPISLSSIDGSCIIAWKPTHTCNRQIEEIEGAVEVQDCRTVSNDYRILFARSIALSRTSISVYILLLLGYLLRC